MAGRVARKIFTEYFLGTCMVSSKQNAVKVRVPSFVLDSNIHMYFKHHNIVYAHDPLKQCKTGDVILIKFLPQQLTRLITHEVIEVVYPLGDITDPITGKKVMASQYRDHVDEDIELFGKKDSAFDYSKAPQRGKQENKRDFTHKKMYVKYYEDPDNPQLDTI